MLSYVKVATQLKMIRHDLACKKNMRHILVNKKIKKKKKNAGFYFLFIFHTLPKIMVFIKFRDIFLVHPN